MLTTQNIEPLVNNVKTDMRNEGITYLKVTYKETLGGICDILYGNRYRELIRWTSYSSDQYDRNVRQPFRAIVHMRLHMICTKAASAMIIITS